MVQVSSKLYSPTKGVDSKEPDDFKGSPVTVSEAISILLDEDD